MTTQIQNEPGLPAHKYPGHVAVVLDRGNHMSKHDIENFLWHFLGWTLLLAGSVGIGAYFAWIF